MPRVSRKAFLRMTAAAGVGMALTACGTPAATPTTAPVATPAAAATTAPKPTTAPATTPAAAATAKPQIEMAELTTKSPVIKEIPKQFNESPMLADLVKSGKLPAVKDRLPENPLVIQPYDEIGVYGGTMRTGDRGTNITGSDQGLAGGSNNQLFLRISADLKSWEPNVASDCKISDDKTTYTLTLRKGMKWSDGTPFTSKDFQFLWDDIALNKELNPVVPVYMNPQGKLATVTSPDEQTVVIKFAMPQPAYLLTCLAHRYFGYKSQHFVPAEWLKKYHIKYNPNATDEAKAAKYDGWFQRFTDIANPALTKDLPVITPYVVKDVQPQQVSFERNPYFWQVDAAGNQLPYIDSQVMERMSNLEMYNAKIVTGAFDFAGFDASIMNYSAYDAGAKQGNYRITLWNSGKGTEVVYQVNQTYKSDEELRNLHRDVRYRRALSLAINRDEINDLIYFGKAIPRQITAIRLSSYFKPEYEKAWSQYDPDQANKLLDELGLKWDAQHKFRTLPSGKPWQVNLDMYESETPKGPITELVSSMWGKIGLDLQVKSVTRQLLGPRVIANEEPMHIWHGDSCSDILLPVDRRWFTGRGGDDSNIWPTWSQWYESKGKQGEEPPAEVKQGFDDFDKFVETLSPEYADKILANQADKILSIGTVGMAPHPIIVRNNLRNVVGQGTWVWDDLWTWPYHAECWYFKK